MTYEIATPLGALPSQRWILAAREREQRVVRRAAVNRLDERRELRGDPRVQLHDLNRAVGGDEELDVEEARVEPVRGHERGRELLQLLQTSGGERGRVLEALERVRARVLHRVRDADHRHLALVDEALERHLVSRHELLDEEAGDGVLWQAGEVCVSLPVRRVLDEACELRLRVDAARLLRQPAHHRLHPPRRGKRRDAVQQGEGRSRARRHTPLNRARGRLVLARDDGVGARPRQPAALGQLGGEQRRAVFRADHAVGREPGELVEQLARIGVDHVEVRPREAHPVALRPREPLVAGLRTDDEDLTHPRQSRLPASCAEPPR